MPSSQWPGKPQKNQIGFVSLIVIINEFVFVPLDVVNRPLKKPLFTQGAANDDCATECMGGEKMNSTLLPTAATMLLGLKARAPFAPTVTVWMAVEEPVADATATAAAAAEGATGGTAPPPHCARA